MLKRINQHLTRSSSSTCTLCFIILQECKGSVRFDRINIRKYNFKYNNPRLQGIGSNKTNRVIKMVKGIISIWHVHHQVYLFTFCFIFFRSVTVLSDTTQSTLANKTTTNVTTADTIDGEIDPLPILLPLIGTLGIAVIIAILAWKNKWRRTRYFGRKGCKCFFIYSSFDWWY